MWGGYPYGGVYGAGYPGVMGWGGYGAALRRSRGLTTTTTAPLTSSASVNDTLRLANEALKRSTLGL